MAYAIIIPGQSITRCYVTVDRFKNLREDKINDLIRMQSFAQAATQNDVHDVSLFLGEETRVVNNFVKIVKRDNSLKIVKIDIKLPLKQAKEKSLTDLSISM